MAAEPDSPSDAPVVQGEAPAPAASQEERKANAARDARLKLLEQQLAEVSRRLDAAQKAPSAPAPTPVPAPVPAPKPEAKPSWHDGLKVSAYAQPQLEFHQDSEDQLAVGGQPLNQNRFVLRRARLKLESSHRYADFLLELDGNTVKGPSFGVQRAEVSAVYRGADAPIDKAPLIALSAGVLIPSFGYELQESARTRWFMERSLASRAFFPSEPDLGLRLAGKLGFFEYGVAVVNGEPAGQPVGFPLRDPNAAKDVIGRVGVAADVSSVVRARGGVSLLNGTSTFRGTDGTKSVLSWNDLNEDSQVSNIELSATPGSAPSRSSNFKHWAVAADASFAVKTPIGETQFQAELTLANNLDRGFIISDPITSGHDDRQLGYYVALVQGVTRHAFAGLRYDYYDPRTDLLGSKHGKIVPIKATVKTISPLIGFHLPEGLRLSAEWDIVRDHLSTDVRGVPADRKNNVVTFRLQGDL
jgi:hypothetical protein